MPGRSAEAGGDNRRIRSLRSPKPTVDPWTAHGSVLEAERRPDGRVEQALTIFLAGSECPYTCSFCDLWRWTIDGPTPLGALPAQIDKVLAGLSEPHPDRLKLYNASNFFDSRAVPQEDWPRIAELSRGFAGLTVESHANSIGPSVLDFAAGLSGRLELAVGLETIHPVALSRLNKRLDLAQFDRACRFLSDHQIDLRVFVLVGAPCVPAAESVEWAVRTAEYAAGRGAAVVALIPVRGGNGELERLQAAGDFSPPTLAQLEEALDRCLALAPAVVAADLWDAGRLAACSACQADRLERLRRINLTGRAEPRIACPLCDGR